jgi:hypothetical protein
VLERLQGVTKVVSQEGGITVLSVQHHQEGKRRELNATLSEILNVLCETGTSLLSVEMHEPNLERLFLKLTGNRLRD